jgi:hypothetical protein
MVRKEHAAKWLEGWLKGPAVCGVTPSQTDLSDGFEFNVMKLGPGIG